MNDSIRAIAQARLDEKNMTHIDLARVVGTTSPTVTRAFEETSNRGGISQLWSDILEALDLQLTVEEKR